MRTKNEKDVKAETKPEVQKEEREVPETWIRHILEKPIIGKWVKKEGINISKHKQSAIATTKFTIKLMSEDNTCMLCTDATLNDTAHSKYDLERLFNMIKTLSKKEIEEGRLVITKSPDHPCYITTDRDIMILAPRVE